jgi:muramoyltetrapeptide carboxypeptidase LdcA involved in peptidoglycan recycling
LDLARCDLTAHLVSDDASKVVEVGEVSAASSGWNIVRALDSDDRGSRSIANTQRGRFLCRDETQRMEFTKPRRLQRDDTVAVVSTSWGGPHAFPHVFDAGLAVLTDRFGLRVKEFPTTRMSATALAADPRARAADLNAAFADDSVRVIIASIGGDDSARILPYLDSDIIRANPKILMGYSDTATQLVFFHNLGLVTFNGPSVMAGFAQLPNFPLAEAHIRAMLFEPTESLRYEPYPQWVDSYLDWNDPANITSVGELRPHDGWHWLNGSGTRIGRLFGGCIEVLEFLKGSRHWPAEDFWTDRIVFLETSEDKPTIEQVRCWLFNYGIQGAFDDAAGLLFGRARGYSDAAKIELDQMILDIVVGQFGAADLTIVSNLDFGHTDPQWILPLGVRAELDSNEQSFRLLEPAVS